jgi:hypothetical protein
MPDVPVFHIRPPFRCWHPIENRPGRVCGELAAWSSPAGASARPGFFCSAHKREGDTAIANDEPFRRVSITLEVLLNGTSYEEHAATMEALSVVERALENAGGLVNLHTSHSEIGRWRPSVPLRASIAAGGVRKP